MTKFLSIEEVLAIRDAVMDDTGGRNGILDFTLLHSAIERPEATFAGVDLYPTLFEKAAALMQSLILNHPFNDGNKRTALSIAVRFLFINGYTLIHPLEKTTQFTLDIQKEKRSVEKISLWLQKHCKKIK